MCRTRARDAPIDARGRADSTRARPRDVAMRRGETTAREATSRARDGAAGTKSGEADGFVRDAGVGCHIALDVARANRSSWLLGAEVVDPDEYSSDAEFPDVALDADGRGDAPRLSATNADGSDAVKVAYITVYDVKCCGKGNKPLAQGVTIDNDGRRSMVTTFVCLVPPRAMAHLCFLRLEGRDVRDVRIDSDFRAWSMHPNPNDTHSQSVGFPLRGERFLCTQSEGGELTHFFSGNLHAVDFRCPDGTPVLAVGDGEVIEVRDENTLTGIAVSNLFKWNSIVLKLDARSTPQTPPRNASAACATTTEADVSTYDVRGGDFICRVRAHSRQERQGKGRRPRAARTSHMRIRLRGIQPRAAFALYGVSLGRRHRRHRARLVRSARHRCDVSPARGVVLHR